MESIQVYSPFLLLPVVARCTPDELVVVVVVPSLLLVPIILPADDDDDDVVVKLLLIMLWLVIAGAEGFEVMSLGEKSPLLIDGR